MCLQDGYKLIRADELTAALAAVNARRITFRAFRAYVACFELLAIREAAERSRANLKMKRSRRFLLSEVSKLLDSKNERPVSRELTALRKTGLLTFSESVITISATGSAEVASELGTRGGKRLIPVPRRVLRFLAGCNRPALVKTIIAYLLRGLSLERSGTIRNRGTVKISWICKLCQISERAARAARAELIRLGWITKDTCSFQRKLNRDGAYFVINTAWKRVFKQFAPPRAEKCREFAPPLKRLETLSDSKNQKLQERNQSGFYGEERLQDLVRSIVSKDTSDVLLQRTDPDLRNYRTLAQPQITKPSAAAQALPKPDVRNIRPEDIRKPSRLRELYCQAVKAGWLRDSEANLLNFAAAAVRANRAVGDSVRIFVGIVRKGLWHHISASDEERGAHVLRSILERPKKMPGATNQEPVQGAEGLGLVSDILQRHAGSFGFEKGL